MSTKITSTDDDLRRMYIDEGLRIRDIASIYSCSNSAVSLRLKQAGIKTRSIADYPPTEKQIYARQRNGRRLGMSKEAMAGRIKAGRSNKGRRKRSDYEFGGHEKKRDDGYIKVYVPDHPNSTSDGYVMKHILVIERAIGRYLVTGECVHHINHIRDDNRLENLQLMTTSEHMSMHMRERHAKRRKSKC